MLHQYCFNIISVLSDVRSPSSWTPPSHSEFLTSCWSLGSFLGELPHSSAQLPFVAIICQIPSFPIPLNPVSWQYFILLRDAPASLPSTSHMGWGGGCLIPHFATGAEYHRLGMLWTPQVSWTCGSRWLEIQDSKAMSVEGHLYVTAWQKGSDGKSGVWWFW